MTIIADTLRQAFRERAIGAVERMARETSPEMLAIALAAPTDAGTLARVTVDQAGSDALRHLEPLAGSIARGAEARTRLIDRAGEFLSAVAVGKLLGISRAAVDKRRAANRLLALRVRGDWLYPALQFEHSAVVEGLPDILAAMAGTSPWVVLDVLLAPADTLGGQTPFAALRAGKAAVVGRIVGLRDSDAFG